MEKRHPATVENGSSNLSVFTNDCPAPSSNGRTTVFGTVNGSSNLPGATNPSAGATQAATSSGRVPIEKGTRMPVVSGFSVRRPEARAKTAQSTRIRLTPILFRPNRINEKKERNRLPVTQNPFFPRIVLQRIFSLSTGVAYLQLRKKINKKPRSAIDLDRYREYI